MSKINSQVKKKMLAFFKRLTVDYDWCQNDESDHYYFYLENICYWNEKYFISDNILSYGVIKYRNHPNFFLLPLDREKKSLNFEWMSKKIIAHKDTYTQTHFIITSLYALEIFDPSQICNHSVQYIYIYFFLFTICISTEYTLVINMWKKNALQFYECFTVYWGANSYDVHKMDSIYCMICTIIIND